MLDNSSEGSEGTVIMPDILNEKDIRCDNKSCTIKAKCKRYRQHLIDTAKSRVNYNICSTFSSDKFIREGFNYEKDCNYFIKITK
jgi:hypothetical protein